MITDAWQGYRGLDAKGYVHRRRSQRAARAAGEDPGKLLLILEWLRAPETHFPAQRDGDLVRDGVCSLFIADKLGVSQPTCGEHLKILTRVHAAS